MTQTYYTKDIDGEYSVAHPQPTLREMEPEDIDDTMSVAERAVRIVLAKAKGVCLSKVHAIDHAGNSYLREASATQCANAIGALNIQPLVGQVHGILSLPTQPEPPADEESFDNDGIHESVIRGLDGRAAIAVTLEFGPNNPGMREANARRIVACVNACTGITTDVLEQMPSGPASLLPMYARLEQQRDKLLAALTEIAELDILKYHHAYAIAKGVIEEIEALK